jgi:hypothetical protein
MRTVIARTATRELRSRSGKPSAAGNGSLLDGEESTAIGLGLGALRPNGVLRSLERRVLRWISDPSCHLAEQRIVGVVEGEQKGGKMTASAEGPAKGWAAEAIYDRLLGRMASLATGHAGNARRTES